MKSTAWFAILALIVLPVIAQDDSADVDNLNLIPKVWEQHADACSPANYSFTIQNTGPFAESYEISVDRLEDDTRLSENPVVIGPGQQKDVLLVVKPGDCKQYGNYTIGAIVDATASGRQLILDHSLEIKPTHVLEIAKGVSGIRVNQTESTALLPVRNLGDHDTAVLLSTSGLDWISIPSERVTVPANSASNITLVLKPTNETKGKFAFTLTAAVAETGTEYSKEFTVRVKAASAWSRMGKLQKTGLILGILALAVLLIWLLTRKPKTPEELEAKAKLEKIEAKKKAAEEARKLKEEEARRKEEERAEQERREKREAEEKKRQAERDAKERERLKENARKETEASLRSKYVFVEKAAKPARSWKWLWWVALLLLVVAAGAAGWYWRSTVWTHRIAALIGAGAAVFLLLALWLVHRLSSRTIIEKTWPLLSDKEHITCWKTGLGEATFTPEDKVHKARLTIARTHNQQGYVAPEGAVYEYFKLATDNIVPESVDLKFKVPLSWFEKNRVKQSSLRLVRFANDKWSGTSVEKLGEDGSCAAFQASPDRFGIFAIVGRQEPEEETHGFFAGLFASEKTAKRTQEIDAPEPKREIKQEARKETRKPETKKQAKPARSREPSMWIAYVVLLLIVLGVIAFSAYYLLSLKPEKTAAPESIPIVTQGIPAQAWDQDTVLSLDLAKYFRDPDNDSLDFTASASEHVSVTFSNGIATLKPENGWHGTTNITFSADDGKGGKVTSNIVPLVVRRVEQPVTAVMVQWLKPYGNYIIAGVIIAAFIILFLEFRKPIVKFLEKE